MRRKTGVWIIGARGAVATNVALGLTALGKNLIPGTGLVTATEPFRSAGLIEFADLVLGGCDIRNEPLTETARRYLAETNAVPYTFPEAVVRTDLEDIDSRISKGLAFNCGKAIRSLAETETGHDIPGAEAVEIIRRQVRNFKKNAGVETVIVINLASTEPPLADDSCHHELELFCRAISDPEKASCFRASTLYAYAAVLEKCPYINFTPSNGALLPALIQAARQRGVPVMGSDGKTGETLLKSVLAPMFLARNLDVLSWEGFNILGNMDGLVLAEPDNNKAKQYTKQRILSQILGYSPHSEVHINYVPSLADQKIAWDLIHFQGFMNARMSLQFTWQGYDSLLAAPLVIDLARLADLALRRAEAGLMPHLAFFFKSPQGSNEYDLARQYETLLHYIKDITVGNDLNS